MTETQGSPLAGAENSTGRLLWQVTNRWQSAQRAALKPLGLTHAQFVLLASLTQLTADGPVSQRVLAEHAATDPMMTSQVVRALEAGGWVKRAAHPDDGRAWALHVTRSGASVARKASAVVERTDGEFFAALGTRAAAFRAALRALGEAG